MCPIETPEGPNIGLINYLASFAQVNEYGFVEAPFRKVDKETGFVTDTVQYMTADVEDDYYVAQANERLDENGCLANARITCRHRNEIIEVDRNTIDYIDVSPKMMCSVATAFIPFLQNDDANRAPHGRQHAAPGCAPHGDRSSHCGHGHRAQVRRRLRGLHQGQGRR